MTSTAVGTRDWGDPLAPTGYALLRIHDLTKRIIELLQVEKEDLVVDLCCRDGPSVTLEEVRLRTQTIAVSPFGERLALLLITSGVHMVQMSDLTFGRFPMRYEKVLLRGGFSQFKSRPHDLLAPLFNRLESTARFLVVDSAPSPDTQLFADGLRRWERHHCPRGDCCIDEGGRILRASGSREVRAPRPRRGLLRVGRIPGLADP